MKPVPRYWWDFGHGKTVLVESNHPKYPLCGVIGYGPGAYRTADEAVKEAEKLVADLEAGRADPKNMVSK